MFHSSNPRRPSGRPAALSLLGAAVSAAVGAGLLAGVLAAPAAAGQPELQAELIVNGDFTSGVTAPWWWTENNPASVVDGQLCADVAGGTTNPWDAIIGENDLPLVAGESYTLSYTASASTAAAITTNVQEAEEPYTQELSVQDDLTAEPQPFEHTFTAQADNDAAQLAFQIGGDADDFTFCVDDVSLSDGAAQ